LVANYEQGSAIGKNTRPYGRTLLIGKRNTRKINKKSRTVKNREKRDMKIDNCVPGYEFDKVTDCDISPYWFQDGAHSIHAWTPMFGWFWVNLCRHGTQYAAERLSLPTFTGWDCRFKDGRGYFAPLIVKDADERKARQERFRIALKPFIDDFKGMWNHYLEDLTGRYEDLKRLDLGTATNSRLLKHFEETIDACRYMWVIHMYMVYGLYTGFVLFEQMAKELLDIDDTKPQFHKLIRGLNSGSFHVDKRLFELGQKARGMGLQDIFLSTSAAGLRSALQSAEKGPEFLKAFDRFMEAEAGWRMERMAEINMPTWLEDPSPAFNVIKMGLEKGIEYNLDRERKKIEAEKAAAERKVLRKVTPEQRGWFTTILRLAQMSAWFSEEHHHFLDLYAHAMVRRSALGIGRRFVKAGAIDAVDDIFFLIPDEIRRAGINPDMFNLSPIVDYRKEEWKRWNKKRHPRMIVKKGFATEDAMKAVTESLDPLALKVVIGATPVARHELKADLFGVSGSSGVAEGVVKVVRTEAELRKIQRGDILVAPMTVSSWMPVFFLLGGVIVDRGGSLSHAAVTGREFGIPVVMNTFEGTRVLKDGMKVRLDADTGAVYIVKPPTRRAGFPDKE
jgi:phosphohistidine swiveling domain-containing protein